MSLFAGFFFCILWAYISSYITNTLQKIFVISNKYWILSLLPLRISLTLIASIMLHFDISREEKYKNTYNQNAIWNTYNTSVFLLLKMLYSNREIHLFLAFWNRTTIKFVNNREITVYLNLNKYKYTTLMLYNLFLFIKSILWVQFQYIF